MEEPEKPFACSIPDCGKTFTNEDHLHVHTRKHDMYLQLGIEQKAGFVADQTPTPTRFIRNCEEVGLFQDLQSVNPFDEGFKRAIETKQGILSLENVIQSASSEELHTPQMFPVLDSGDAALFTTNNHKNITISRSSSDESETIKEYETTTISKLTNEVTTISRIVNKLDVPDKTHSNDDAAITKNDDGAIQKDLQNGTSVSYTNNVIKIHNNIEIRKDNLINVDSTKIPATLISYADTVIKDASSIISKDVLLTDGNKNHLDAKMPPIMSQKSFDFVVDSLTADICQNTKPEVKIRSRKCAKPITRANLVNNANDSKKEDVKAKNDDYEVYIKLPNGKQVRMKAVEELSSPEKTKIENNTKEKLKLALANKASQKNTLLQRLQSITTPVHNIVPITTGTLIPVTLVNSNAQILQKIPIAPFNPLLKPNQEFKKTVKRKNDKVNRKVVNDVDISVDDDDDCVIVDEPVVQKKTREDLNSRVAASRRYRVRLKETMKRQVLELKQLKESNQRLAADKAALKLLIAEHMKTCPQAHLLRIAQEKITQSGPAK